MLCCAVSCRVTIVDDARGVGEPLNETLCGCTGSSCDCPAGGLPARGKHVLVLGPTGTAAAALRAAQQRLNDLPVLAFSDLGAAAVQQRQRQTETAAATGRYASSAAASILAGQQQQLGQQQQGEGLVAALGLQGRWSGAAEAVLAAGGLPPNVHMLTLMRAEEVDPSKLILRLAHTFQVGSAAVGSVACWSQRQHVGKQHCSSREPQADGPLRAVAGWPVVQQLAATALSSLWLSATVQCCLPTCWCCAQQGTNEADAADTQRCRFLRPS